MDKGDAIILHRENSQSASEQSISIRPTVVSQLYPEKYYYRNYCYSGQIYLTTATMSGHMMLLRDDTVSPAEETTMISYSGDKVKVDGLGEVATLNIDAWNDFEIYIDLDNHKGNLFINGELKASDFPVYDKITNICGIRTSIYTGQGDIQLKNCKFTGLKYPMEKQVTDGKTVPVIKRMSQFPDDSQIKGYLIGKTVLHGDGGIIYKNNTKVTSNSEMIYNAGNDELYISFEDFKKAVSVNLTYSEENCLYTDGENYYEAPSPIVKDGVILIPAVSLAREIGYYAEIFEYGKMVIISRENDLPEKTDEIPSWFDETFYSEGDAGFELTQFTDVQEISNFIFYDRPTAIRLQSDFNRKTQNGTSHPRIGLTPEIMDYINALRLTDAVYNQKVERYIAQTEDLFSAEAPQYVYSDGLRTLKAANSFNSVVIPMAFCYQLTKDERYARRAIDDLMTVSSFPDYNPGHVIDMGMWLKGMGYAYDWCYDAMSDTERRTISDAIIKKGIEVINKAYYADLPAAVCLFGERGATHASASFFPKWKSNFTGYTQGGVILAALAVAEKAPDICFDTIEKAMRAWEYSNFGFYSSGAWIEGKTYQNVVNTGMADSMSACMTALGDTYNIPEYPGVKENLDVLMSLNSKTASFTYADDNARDPLASITSVYSFFSNYYDDEKLAKWRQHKLGENGAGDWMDLAYYRENLDADTLSNVPVVSYTPGAELFSVHENADDANALFFATAGGPTRHYHAHNDGGDFIICMDGERWSYDIGQGNYNVGTNYTRYSGRTEAHNTLTINPDKNYSQAEHSFAEIIDYGEGSGGAYAVMDMTSLYAHHGAQKVWRGFYIGDNYDTVTIRDEMNFSQDATGYWFMTTEASVEKINEETLLLERNGKTLYLQYECEGENATASIDIMEAAPLPTSPQLDGDTTAINPSLKKVAIYFEGSGDIAITVRMSASPDDIDLTPVSEWTAP